MTSRVFDGAPNEIEIVGGQKDDTNSQSSSTQKHGTEASDRDSDIDVYEGGNSAAKSQYTSRQDIAYDDDESQGSQDEEEAEDADADNEQLKPNLQFNNYAQLFQNLTKSKNVETKFPIVTCIISYDSTRAITVIKKNDREFWVMMYSLQTYENTFTEMIGGKEDSYIRCKEVQQNAAGQKYALMYVDDGKFRLRVFGKETRDAETIQREEFDINTAIGINDYTMPIQGFADPFCTCSFIDDDRIFVQLFYNHDLTHYHFIYSHSKGQIEGNFYSKKMQCTSKNFPYQSFHNSDENVVYSFYRQGQAFTVNGNDANEVQFEKMTDMDLGQMYLFNNKALIARSSSKVVFFKVVQEEDENKNITKKWKQYNQIDVRGFIYFIKGNKRIQVTTDDKVYFYLIDPETFEPTLENVMFNFMGCNQMMFGSRVRYGITYKTNQKSFTVYRRKFMHDFRVPVMSDNLEGSMGIDLQTMNAFLVTKIDKIFIFDAETFEIKGEIPIKLLKTETREPNQIISMRKSVCEEFLAVISGKNLIMKQQKVNQLFVFKKNANENYELYKRIVVKDIPVFNKVCMQYYFQNVAAGQQLNSLIFVKADRIIRLNFDTEQIDTIHEFKNPLLRQPEFFQMNDAQTVMITASPQDGIYLELTKKKEIDLDELYQIGCMKEIIYDHEDGVFYILANKFEEKLGFFIIRMNEKNPSEHTFLTKWKNKLDLGDANIFVLRHGNKEQQYKELIISYKTIYINTYNVTVMDISQDKGQTTLFRHESFQLWESEVRGLILSKKKDFITMSKAGLNILALGAIDKRQVIDSEKNERMVHSLESVNYLKVAPENFVLFECSDEDRVVSIQQEFQKSNANSGAETNYENIYSIKIHEITLRELLLFQSLFVCKTQSDIVQLVEDQPNPMVFYKSFLEFDGANMVSILSFDSRSMSHLLDDKHADFFSDEFPIFYRNKIQKSGGKYFYRSAIDRSLRCNQVRAVSLMIDYIVKYQNNFVSSYLFLKNFPVLLEKAISVFPLLDSNVFSLKFDYDEWPSSHTNNDTHLRPYNDSIFNIRENYKVVFHEEEFRSIDDMSKNGEEEVKIGSIDTSKVYKIKYSVNLLPIIGEHIIDKDEKNGGEKTYLNSDVNFMGLLNETEELEIYETQTIQELIQFKWDKYARRHHIFGCMMHLFYIFTLVLYINIVYIHNSGTAKEQKTYSILLAVGILYPAMYDWTQMFRGGLENYFSDFWNYTDLLYIWSSIGNVICQNVNGPFHLLSKILMIIIIILALIKTFFFLRIFNALSPIVTMLTNVIYDLRIFLFFYTILIILFSLLLGILGIGNKNIPGEFKNQFENLDEYPGSEYANVGLFVGNLLSTLRMSMGDFGFDAAILLDDAENIIYWFVWLLIVIITCIIFLNFIIAEASASYEKVSEQLMAFILSEKAAMIQEAEEMTFLDFKNEEKFPKYIITREMEE